MKLLALLVVVSFALVASNKVIQGAQLLGYSYAEYLKDFDKHYDTPECLAIHEAQFHETMAKVVRHNMDTTKSWKEGITKFADMTEEEFKAFLGYNKGLALANKGLKATSSVKVDGAVPSAVDWRTLGVVTPVKDQGQCGSCWAFAAVECLESALAINTGNLTGLSPQDIVSCAENPNHCGGTGGCSGATCEIAFQYVADNNLATNADWPYTSRNGVCDSHKKSVASDGYVKITENSYEDLLNAVATVGPIAVSVDAGSWSRYVSGIFTGCSTTNPDINHAVQLVGYGTDSASGNGYWTVRNSWGSSWGEGGYIRLYRGEKETCGVDKNPQDGSGCTGGPATVTVCGSCGIWYDTSYPTGVRFL